MLGFEEVRRIALECKPKMIVAGASAYARKIDFKRFREIADEGWTSRKSNSLCTCNYYNHS